jgi:hypothetical protein
VSERTAGLDAELRTGTDTDELYQVMVVPRGAGAPFGVHAEGDYVNLTVGTDVRFEFDGNARDLADLSATVGEVVEGGAVELFLGPVPAGGWVGAGRRSSSTLLTPVARLVGRKRRYGPYDVSAGG